MDKVLEICETVELSWPTGFIAPIVKEAKTMPLKKKHVGVGATILCAITVMLPRVIVLHASKSTSKRQLQIETSNRHTDQDNSLNIDGSAMFWLSLGQQMEKYRIV